MKKVRCANGHYYDADRYASCPHCADQNVVTEAEISEDFAADHPAAASGENAADSGGMAAKTHTDPAIYRDAQAVICFEPGEQAFVVRPGGAGRVCLNRKPVTAPEVIGKGDILELGDQKLMLIPLCGPEFN